MVYVFKIKDEVIGVFDKVNELALAIWQHRDELNFAELVCSLDNIIDYMSETPTDLNEVMIGGSITDFTLNIDYTTYRLPSLTEEYHRKEHLGL
ncbi:hypothetical protein [Allisonella histaminiformans]|uniref:hypothetical protein n=1 Tax=Allisonella histaminiformans TaxID=209880 RepID=UPI002943634C|nr:hypothetical protein [Allisonella histaminiformans]